MNQMKIEILQYDGPNELILSVDTLYLIFGFGTGDTFNAMIHLCKAPPGRDYDLIVKRPQLNLILFLLGLYQRRPVRIHVVEYWKHDFSLQIAQCFPTIPFARGLEPNTVRNGFVDIWLNPFNYNKVIPLSDVDITAIRGYFGAQTPEKKLPKNSVIFFPTAGANFTDYIPPWEQMVTTLKENGVEHVFVNQSGGNDYGSEVITGAEPIQLSHEELIRTVYSSSDRVNLIAVRSGAIDILRFSGARALVMYQPVPDGIFKTCRFGLLRHNLDLIETICLGESKMHQDQILNYYAKQFIASSVER